MEFEELKSSDELQRQFRITDVVDFWKLVGHLPNISRLARRINASTSEFERVRASRGRRRVFRRSSCRRLLRVYHSLPSTYLIPIHSGNIVLLWFCVSAISVAQPTTCGCCLALSLCHPAISKTSSPSRISIVSVPDFSDWAPLCHTPRTIHELSLKSGHSNWAVFHHRCRGLRSGFCRANGASC
ncbi:hypothetical protein KUCAC02_027991 [Chaenocephalus aceratus]|uniref:Uncharacterized protein n=1 Tax=Chaenocephalus aceratus TaxID=36190 RepID=A0ACB9X1P5_CHAAC|nr:hypothetical protein KUCAC02_027991 [Chaenocephalus aceratus]